MATACAKPPPNGQGLTPVRRHDPLAAVDVSALSGIIGMLSAINRNTVRLRSEQVSAFVGIRRNIEIEFGIAVVGLCLAQVPGSPRTANNNTRKTAAPCLFQVHNSNVDVT